MSAETSKNEGTCFVTMAFGRKTDWETGRTFDLDKVYRHLIQPAVEAAGLKCIRGDEIVQLGPIDIPMYDQLLKADVVVADLSTSRGSVFYELGIRHALRPFTTIIIAEDRIGYLPFDTNIVPFLQYHHLGEDIGHDEVLRFRPLLTAAIVERLEKDPRPTDSPVYLFLTDLGPRNLEFLIERARISGELMLDLRNLSLRVLPNSLRKLEQVETLNLSGNELSALPDWIGQLPQLQTLDLSNNELISLPESLGDLPYLKELDLSNNQISALPPSLSRLTSLTRLALGGNRELGLSSDVLMAKPADIFKYYFRLRGPRRPWNEAKVILVGRGGVGKTCLVNRLLYDRFDQDEKETDGIRITPWKFLLDGKEEVQVNVWDFGGQEIMHATHQFFLTERCIYLLVLSGREGGADADVEYWLQLIESFGSESSVQASF